MLQFTAIRKQGIKFIPGATLKLRHITLAAVVLCLTASCATVTSPAPTVEGSSSRQQQVQAQQAVQLPTQKSFKRKIAVARFSNETRYGRTFITDDNYDPLGKQTSDILSSRLTASNRFIVLERTDIRKIKEERQFTNDASLVGVDTLIVGSLTEFGRNTTGKVGFLSATKLQTAKAKVELRLVDVRTGRVFFSASGSGEASTESGEVAGFGSKADYDGTLNDRAIAAAISDVVGSLMTKLEERPWRTDILKVDGDRVFISGGIRQGIRPGEVLQIYAEGERVKSAQSGFDIALPARPIGKIRIVSSFGNNEVSEGSVADLVAGSATSGSDRPIFVAE